ncbi:MAG: sulfurtransferase TusA family protein [Acidimicrobiales bacterium]
MTPDQELPSADAVIDTSGTCCPMPVVETRKAVTSAVEVGGIVEVIATDPGARYDMPAWARNTGHELLATAGENGTYRFWIKRTH